IEIDAAQRHDFGFAGAVDLRYGPKGDEGLGCHGCPLISVTASSPALRSPERTTVWRPSVAPVRMSCGFSVRPSWTQTRPQVTPDCGGGSGGAVALIASGGTKRSAVLGTSSALCTVAASSSAVAVMPGLSRPSLFWTSNTP